MNILVLRAVGREQIPQGLGGQREEFGVRVKVVEHW